MCSTPKRARYAVNNRSNFVISYFTSTALRFVRPSCPAAPMRVEGESHEHVAGSWHVCAVDRGDEAYARQRSELVGRCRLPAMRKYFARLRDNSPACEFPVQQFHLNVAFVAEQLDQERDGLHQLLVSCPSVSRTFHSRSLADSELHPPWRLRRFATWLARSSGLTPAALRWICATTACIRSWGRSGF